MIPAENPIALLYTPPSKNEEEKKNKKPKQNKKNSRHAVGKYDHKIFSILCASLCTTPHINSFQTTHAYTIHTHKTGEVSSVIVASCGYSVSIPHVMLLKRRTLWS